MKTFDGTRWSNSNSKAVANVMDFGAVGDGSVDESVAVTSAISYLKSLGGGTLYFPPGNKYYLDKSVRLISDIEIIGYGATIFKKGVSDFNSTAFLGVGGDTLGYGSGVNNVVARGITFRGYYNTEDPYNSQGITAFSLHRAQNILVEDCNFIEAQGRGHSFDLGGCRYVTIRNCMWQGYNTQTFSGSAECIQLDQSKRGSVSSQPSSEVYDGTVSCNITIEGCKFLPYTKDGVTYPCPNPLGNHTTREGKPHKDIKFINNFVLDPWEDNSSSSSNQSYRGSVHLIGVDTAEISGNTFRSTKGNPTRCIAIYGVSIGNPVSQDPNVLQDTSTIPPTGCKNIKIHNNVFEGFILNDGYGANYTVSILSASSSTGVSENISICGNTFEYKRGNLTNEIRAQYVNKLRVEGNTFKTVDSTSTSEPIVSATGTDGVIVTRNYYSSSYSGVFNNASNATHTVVEQNLQI